MKDINKKILWISGIVILLMMIGYGIRVLIYGFTPFESYGHMMGGGIMPFGMIGVVAFWVVLVILINYFVDYKESHKDEDAVKNLKTRLSKGEISVEEYEQILKKISEVTK